MARCAYVDSCEIDVVHFSFARRIMLYQLVCGLLLAYRGKRVCSCISLMKIDVFFSVSSCGFRVRFMALFKNPIFVSLQLSVLSLRPRALNDIHWHYAVFRATFVGGAAHWPL